MQGYYSRGLVPSMFQGKSRVWISFGLLTAALAISVPVYAGWFSSGFKGVHRFGMPLLWGVLLLATTRSAHLARFRALLLSLFGVSLGFALAYIVGNRLPDMLKLSWATPRGATVDKIISEVIPMSAAISFAAFLAQSDLALYLRGGRVWLGLGLGLLATMPVLALFAVDPSGNSRAVFALPWPTLRSWFPWIVLFSIANGFMEEFWFRGFWLAMFERALGSVAAVHLTSVAFAVMHVIVYWREPTAILMLTPVWLYMGYSYAVIVRKTGSLWGAVLAHAIADVMFMYIYFVNTLGGGA